MGYSKSKRPILASNVVMPRKVVVSTSSPVNVGLDGLYVNNASGAITYNLPPIRDFNIGTEYTFRNAPTRTGVITLQAPSGVFIDLYGTNGTSGGTLVSGGALGDVARVTAVSLTQYVAEALHGAWTNN